MRILTLLMTMVMSGQLAGQDDLAYMGGAARTERSGTPRLTMAAGALPGSMELVLPEGTMHVDLLNAHGRVKRRYRNNDMTSLDPGRLRPGTWTLRAHTVHGSVVRRIQVLPGGALRTLDRPLVKSHRRIRTPLDRSRL